MRPRALVLLLPVLAAALASGCYNAPVLRGDVAWHGVDNAAPPLPAIASVAAFQDASGGGVPADALFALSKSYVLALEETKLFKGVYADVEAPDAPLRFEGSVRTCKIYENNWYMASWVILGVATFGIFPGVGALLGLPYCTQNGKIYFDVKAVDRATSRVVATYTTDWSDTVVFNIYNDASPGETFFAKPKKAVQAAIEQNLKAVVADRKRFEGIGGAAAPPAPPPQQPPTGSAPPAPPAEAPPAGPGPAPGGKSAPGAPPR